MYEIKGQKKSRAAPSVILAAVRDALFLKHVDIESEDDSSIVLTPLARTTRNIFLHLTWNTFRSVSRGVVSVQRQDGHSILSYKISLLRIRLVITFLSIMAIVGGISSGNISVLLTLVSIVLFLGWGWIYGMNYLITLVRVSNFFDQVLWNLPAEQPPIPKQQIEGVQQGAPADAKRPRR
jgi:hypothetical protein